MAIGVIATLTIQSGKNAEFEEIFSKLAQAVRDNEPGNNYYQLHKSREDAQIYVVMEQYKDQNALDAHGQTDHFKAAGASMGHCMGGAPKIEFFDSIS